MAASVFGSVCNACKQHTSETDSSRSIKLGTHTCYDKRTKHTAFQGQCSKVKVIYQTLLNAVDTKEAKLFEPGPSNLVHILVMTIGQPPLVL